VEDYVARHTGGRAFDVVYDTVGCDTLAVLCHREGGHVTNVTRIPIAEILR
jgi:hypothetical protein